MRTIDTLVFVLLAGILSSTTIQGEISRHRDIKSPEYIELLKKECERNGGPEAYAEVKASERLSGDCIGMAGDTLKPKDGILTSVPVHGMAEYAARNFCPKVSHFKNCVKHITEPLKICMEPKYRDTVNVTHKVINLLLDFVCENDGQRIIEFVTDGGYECAMYGSLTLQGCVSQFFSDYVPAGDVETQRFPPPLGIEECTIMKNFQSCTLEVFKICERSTPAKVLNSMFKFAEQNTPCGNLLEPESSSAEKQN